VDHLKLFNEVAKVARPVNAQGAEAKELDQLLKDTGYDSLDLLMVGIYLSDIFGVDEDTAKSMNPETVKDMIEFFIKHAKKHPESVESAIKQIK
jgi:acyl carrier protein